mmetsp:Transcript_13688/g.29812  ORF Transcript_13688/g.29812 Transcript_13688/m.29812 type:complete len:122 (+) Transcript_13688:1872-2237(+)
MLNISKPRCSGVMEAGPPGEMRATMTASSAASRTCNPSDFSPGRLLRVKHMRGGICNVAGISDNRYLTREVREKESVKMLVKSVVDSLRLLDYEFYCGLWHRSSGPFVSANLCAFFGERKS